MPVKVTLTNLSFTSNLFEPDEANLNEYSRFYVYIFISLQPNVKLYKIQDSLLNFSKEKTLSCGQHKILNMMIYHMNRNYTV